MNPPQAHITCYNGTNDGKLSIGESVICCSSFVSFRTDTDADVTSCDVGKICVLQSGCCKT